MGSIEANRGFWQAYDWEQGGEEWSGPWGSSFLLWHGSLLPRLASFLPTDHLLEIAPGFGRITGFLLPHCRRYTGVDLSERCVAACRESFRHVEKASFHGNDGRSLDMVEDASVDFAFSWDSLVHVDQEVMRSYLLELSRKLGPGASAFLHHSNLGSVETAKRKGRQDPHGRDPGMTHGKLRDFCRETGLHCRSQELLTWGERVLKDCISVLRRPLPGEKAPETRITEHHAFVDEAGNLLRIHTIYG